MTWLHWLMLGAAVYVVILLILVNIESPEEFQDVDELAKEDRK